MATIATVYKDMAISPSFDILVTTQDLKLRLGIYYILIIGNGLYGEIKINVAAARTRYGVYVWNLLM